MKKVRAYKMKTNRSAAKRFSLTAKGRVRRKHAGMRHFMRRKNMRTKRHLRNRGYVAPVDERQTRVLLPYG